MRAPIDESQETRTFSRREMLKAMAAVTGAAAMAGLPNKWQKPLVQAGALPAHAQSTLIPGLSVIGTGEGPCEIAGVSTDQNYYVQVGYYLPAGAVSFSIGKESQSPGGCTVNFYWRESSPESFTQTGTAQQGTAKFVIMLYNSGGCTSATVRVTAMDGNGVAHTVDATISLTCPY